MSVATGDCFEVAANLALAFDSENVRLCHGWVTGQGPLDGVRFEHGWVELGDGVVIDVSNGREWAGPKWVYYHAGQISEAEVRRYTPTEARVHMLRTSHYGPWEDL